jgi:hypothetical protein
MIELRIVADTNGRVEACEAGSPPLRAATIPFFCGQARSETVKPPRDGNGVAMRSAQLFRIRLSSDQALDAVIDRARGKGSH